MERVSIFGNFAKSTDVKRKQMRHLMKPKDEEANKQITYKATNPNTKIPLITSNPITGWFTCCCCRTFRFFYVYLWPQNGVMCKIYLTVFCLLFGMLAVVHYVSGVCVCFFFRSLDFFKWTRFVNTNISNLIINGNNNSNGETKHDAISLHANWITKLFTKLQKWSSYLSEWMCVCGWNTFSNCYLFIRFSQWYFFSLVSAWNHC